MDTELHAREHELNAFQSFPTARPCCLGTWKMLSSQAGLQADLIFFVGGSRHSWSARFPAERRYVADLSNIRRLPSSIVAEPTTVPGVELTAYENKESDQQSPQVCEAIPYHQWKQVYVQGF
jgi:hypothetical protein